MKGFIEIRNLVVLLDQPVELSYICVPTRFNFQGNLSLPVNVITLSFQLSFQEF